MKKSLYIVVLIFLSCTSRPDTLETTEKIKKSDSAIIPEKQKVREPKIVLEKIYSFDYKNPNIAREDTLILTTESDYYELLPTGLLTINQTQSIQLQTEFLVEKAFLYSDLKYLYVFFTETDDDVATSSMQKIDKEQLTIEYSTVINGFNLGLPAISDNKAYVTAIGLIGRVDMETGEYDWKKDDLYDNKKRSFNSFDTVIISTNTVDFISENYHTKNRDKVVVGRNNGEVIEIVK